MENFRGSGEFWICIFYISMEMLGGDGRFVFMMVFRSLVLSILDRRRGGIG